MKNLNRLKNEKEFGKLKIVVDTANGMGGFILPYLQETYNIMDVHDWNWSLDSMYRFIFMSKMQRYRIDEYKNRDTTSHELPVMAHNMHYHERSTGFFSIW